MLGQFWLSLRSTKCYMIWQCYSSLIGSVFSSCVSLLSKKDLLNLSRHSFETCHHSDGCFWGFFHLLPSKALLVLDILAYKGRKKIYSTFPHINWFLSATINCHILGQSNRRQLFFPPKYITVWEIAHDYDSNCKSFLLACQAPSWLEIWWLQHVVPNVLCHCV